MEPGRESGRESKVVAYYGNEINDVHMFKNEGRPDRHHPDSTSFSSNKGLMTFV